MNSKKKVPVILAEVKNRQASKNTICHALYGYYFNGLKRSQLARIYGKHETTIANWIMQFESNGNIGRKRDKEVAYRKFGHLKRQWLIELYSKQPILYLSEAQKLFFEKFHQSISVSSIHIILHEAGLTWKVLERRAIQLQLRDILRFCDELSKINWSWENLVFLDEVSFNGSDMLRKKGYGVKGENLVFRGEFTRTARISLLCFLGVHGVLDCFETEGTFTRKVFAECCRKFALESGCVKTYPGPGSVWILDGAKIHCSDKLIYYLRSLGIVIIFLPAYAPMLNPIEIIFGILKQKLRKNFKENFKIDKKIFLCEILNEFQNKYYGKLFAKSGYLASGLFDPSRALNLDLAKFGYQ
uniref:CSON007819 protein n=1 Tax=Culicoides sonorensis TaxID=179676 RepID=A0A336N0V1_CULSO